MVETAGEYAAQHNDGRNGGTEETGIHRQYNGYADASRNKPCNAR